MSAPPFPVVAFDLDGTLLRGTSVSLYLAEWMGQGDLITEVERRFRANEISNSEVADISAAWFAGIDPDEVWNQLATAPWIRGIDQTLAALTAADCHVLLGTVTWRFAADMLQRRYGFEAVSGTEMRLDNGLLSGTVSRHFNEHDKVCFVESWCAQHGFGIEQAAAVGDSRSDVPLFARPGCAIALNATADARAAADHVVDSEDLTDVLEYLLEAGRTSTGEQR